MWKLFRVIVVICLLMASWFGMFQVQAAGESFNLYVSPKGDDDSDGQSEAKPLRTLAKALSVYLSVCNSRSTRITLAAGSYGNESLALRSVPCPLKIDSSGGYAQFDGSGNGTWFTIAAPG